VVGVWGAVKCVIVHGLTVALVNTLDHCMLQALLARGCARQHTPPPPHTHTQTTRKKHSRTPPPSCPQLLPPSLFFAGDACSAADTRQQCLICWLAPHSCTQSNLPSTPPPSADVFPFTFTGDARCCRRPPVSDPLVAATPTVRLSRPAKRHPPPLPPPKSTPPPLVPTPPPLPCLLPFAGDARTAADARHFLIRWLQRFPQYAHADLYLSGESYGGHYVPNLAREIVRGNKKPTAAAAAAGVGDGSSAAVVTDGSSSDSSSSSSEGSVLAVGRGDGHLNLKGFFVGNAWTDAAIDNRGASLFGGWWWGGSVCVCVGGLMFV
jgi:hypothetical protein